MNLYLNDFRKKYNYIFSYILCGICLTLGQISYADEDQKKDDQITHSYSYSLSIEDIVCQGNENTKCSFITKKYYQKLGDKLNPEELTDARLRLGALQQFRNVSTHLEKGSEKGKVIVVFVVQEASYIQYSFNTNFSHSETKTETCFLQNPNDPDAAKTCWNNSFRTDSASQSASVTNFNFLGKGKELSVFTNFRKSDSDTSVSPENEFSSNNTVDSDNLNTILNYYDPHLLGSPYYFLDASISYDRRNSKFTTTLTTDDNTTTTIDSEQDTSITTKSLEIGKRFGRYSFVSLGVSDSNINSDAQVHSITFGRDSRDDTILPTSGSAIQASYYRLDSSDLASFSFGNYFSKGDRNVFSYDIFASISETDDDNQFRSYGSKIEYTRIYKSNKNTGQYSAIRFGLSARKSSNDIDNLVFHTNDNSVSSSLYMSYIYQSDKLIYQLNFNYRNGDVF